MFRLGLSRRTVALACVVAGVFAASASAQDAIKIAVIDVNRIMTDSERGKGILEEIEKYQADKADALRTINEDLQEMQSRFQEGRLSLAEDKLAELQAQIESKGRELQRAQEDAQRDLQKKRAEDIKKVENEVFPIINAVGAEFGYDLIFNKFQSGLVFANDQIDITDLVIQRYDAAASE